MLSQKIRQMNPSDINFDDLRDLTIGTVESVSPREIKILLDLNAPKNTALNTGTPTLFPKINGYVLLPNEAGALIGMISWIWIEHSPYPKRKGFKDFGLIDLPFPLRKMTISPLGILKKDDNGYTIERGVYSYPSVGDAVVIPTHEQLRSIVENKDENAKIQIGNSPLAANAPVYVDPDKLFGRHVAVLGNTGSGKSCSVAGLIRWSLEAATKEIQSGKNPNARFIILDPNGEYTNTFRDISGEVRKFRVAIDENNKKFQQLEVPAWMWNSYEWSSITQASGKTQRPLLRQALRAMRNQVYQVNDSADSEVKNFLGNLLTSLRIEKNNGSPWGSFPRPKNFTQKIDKWNKSIETFIARLEDSDSRSKLVGLNSLLNGLLTARSGQYPTYEFDISEVDSMQDKILIAFEAFGGTDQDLLLRSEDVPVPFKSEIFVRYLEALAKESESSQYLDYLLMRLRTTLADTRMSSIIGTETDITLPDWLDKYVGNDSAENGPLTIIDLSLVPPDIIHIVVAVMSRIIFEAIQRYRRKNATLLPTVLVMEEAHNFISKYKTDSDEFSPSKLCSQTFEKIAKEGRKFGLGLLVSSQRPSELSPTVLSQCNTFLLHRLVNDRDQELVKRFVPDNLGSILNELPVLPTKKAILLGWAAPVPILVDMNELKKEHRPDSKDPDFWDVWTLNKERKINWKEIADEWQEKGDNEQINTSE